MEQNKKFSWITALETNPENKAYVKSVSEAEAFYLVFKSDMWGICKKGLLAICTSAEACQRVIESSIGVEQQPERFQGIADLDYYEELHLDLSGYSKQYFLIVKADRIPLDSDWV